MPDYDVRFGGDLQRCDHGDNRSNDNSSVGGSDKEPVNEFEHAQESAFGAPRGQSPYSHYGHYDWWQWRQRRFILDLRDVCQLWWRRRRDRRHGQRQRRW